MLPPVAPGLRVRSQPRGPPSHHGHDEPPESRVEEHVPHARHLPEGRRDGDHIAEWRENVRRRDQVVLRTRVLEQQLQPVRLTRRLERVTADRHAAVGDDLAVGVLGDERVYGHIVTIRIVESLDAMTADWSRIPYDLISKISNRITNEVNGVTWVTYSVSSKPPATIEPQ